MYLTRERKVYEAIRDGFAVTICASAFVACVTIPVAVVCHFVAKYW